MSKKQAMKKIQLKILNETTGKLKWQHFCYISLSLFDQFVEIYHIHMIDLSDFIADWAKRDFNIDLSMTTRFDVAVLKELILSRYRDLYPELCTNQTDIDEHGWLRVWLSENMKRCL